MISQQPENPSFNFIPLRIYINPKNTKIKKLRKDGKVICYKCRWCPYQSLNLSHTKRHMTKCPTHSSYMGQATNQYIYQSYLNHEKDVINRQMMINQQNIEEQPQIDTKQRLNLIQHRIKALQVGNTGSYLVNQRAKRISQQIIQQNSSLFIGCIQVQLSRVIKSWLQIQVDVEGLKFQIVSKILDKIRQINFSNLVDNYKKNIETFQSDLEKNLKPKVHDRTWSRIKMAYNFMKKYQQLNLVHQTKIIQDLMAETQYLRTHVLRYYKKMISQYSDLFPYKQLPKRLTIYDEQIPKKHTKISLDKVQQQILMLIQKNEKELAIDIWSTTCMGFRKSELLKMKFQNDVGEFAFAIRILQQKNNHETLRVVPSSLKSLIKAYSPTYPMSKLRFQKLRKFCLENFKAFYGLRHLCLTTIMAGLFENNALARVHKDHRTTSKFYIDDESAQIINNMFFLPGYNEAFSNQKLLFVFNRYGQLHEQQIKQTKKIDFPVPIISIEENFDMLQMDGLIKANDQQMKTFLEESSLSSSDKSQIVSKRFGLINQQRQVSLKNYNSIEKTLQSLVQQNYQQLSEIINQQIFSRGDIITDDKIIKQTSQIFNSPIKFITFQENVPTPLIIQKLNFQDEENQPLLIIKHLTSSGNFYHIEEGMSLKTNQSIRQKFSRSAKENKSYLQDEALPVLKYSSPLCSFCKKSQLKIQVCDKQKSHGYTYCQFCKSKTHLCKDLSSYKFNQIKLRSKNFIQSKDFFKSIPKKNIRNNIRYIIEMVRKSTFISECKYKSDVPNFSCSLPIFSKKMTQQINYNRKNEQYLPIQLKIQTKQRGYGAFATQNILSGRLICTYNGVVGTHNSVNVEHDSSFTLGWLQTKNSSLNIITEAKEFCNVGRFLNSSVYYKAPDMNCECKYGLINKGSVEYQITIIIYTVKPVKAGTQLIWFYGQKYWHNNELEAQGSKNSQQME